MAGLVAPGYSATPKGVWHQDNEWSGHYEPPLGSPYTLPDGRTWDKTSGTYIYPPSGYVGGTGGLTPGPPPASAAYGSGGGYGGASVSGGLFHAPTFTAPVFGGPVDPDADLKRELLRNQIATSAPGYTAPMSAAQAAANALAVQGLAATSAYQQGQLGLGQGELGLSTSKFNQTVKDRSGALAALERLFGSGGGAGTGVSEAGGKPAMDADPIDPTTGLTMSESNAQRAALTQAKERGGERLSSSLRSLNGMMAERGITGSGIEAANMRGLFQENLHNQQDTENSLIQGRAGRAAQLADWTRNRGANVEDRNYAAAQANKAQEVNALLGIYGMSY